MPIGPANLFRHLDQPLDRVVLRQVSEDGVGAAASSDDGMSDPFGRSLAAAMDDDGRALPREGQGDGLAVAIAAARHLRRLIVQLQVRSRRSTSLRSPVEIGRDRL